MRGHRRLPSVSKGSPNFQMRLNASERGEVEALAERLGVPRATAMKAAVRAALQPPNDSRPAVTGREEHLNRREVADAHQEYPESP